MCIATAKLPSARVSLKHSAVLCKQIKGKPLGKAKLLLQELIEKRRSINSKYYCKAANTLLQLLKDAEANAKQKGLNSERLFVVSAKADKGFTFLTPKTRYRFRRRRKKLARLEVCLEER